jgi:HEPN domain-containing protein
MKRITREWIRKAEEDFRAADLLATGREPLHDLVCFHCQQCAEKYLKALLEELTFAFSKTHNLEGLLNLLLPHHSSLGRYRRGLRFLTQFAVDPRYPLMRTTKSQAESAQRWAGKVRAACRRLLGLPSSPPRSRKRL